MSEAGRLELLERGGRGDGGEALLDGGGHADLVERMEGWFRRRLRCLGRRCHAYLPGGSGGRCASCARDRQREILGGTPARALRCLEARLRQSRTRSPGRAR
ncbi:hypothetical protein GCM10023169_20540 [Georgenia halophila]|uniref:Uncharacterized protein n=1 Tax=Georgenia halophila TaxID=620889 RepID=A0ABP8L892_9MICO